MVCFSTSEKIYTCEDIKNDINEQQITKLSFQQFEYGQEIYQNGVTNMTSTVILYTTRHIFTTYSSGSFSANTTSTLLLSNCQHRALEYSSCTTAVNRTKYTVIF